MSGETLREHADATEREFADTVREDGPGAAGIGNETLVEPAATVREDAACVDGAGGNETLRESAPPDASRQRGPRVNLPESIQQNYEWVRDLEVTSGEADVCVIRDRESGVVRFFKHYHQGKYPEENVLTALQSLDNRDHVVEIIDYSPDPIDAWEIHEYCELGTLAKGVWADNHAFPYDETVIREVLEETSAAIHHIHHIGDGIAHRDIKPSNILIRSEGPLDLVLTDFGIARNQQTATHRTLFAGTNFYAAPEALDDKSSKESDWFALGAIVYELLTQHKLLASRGNASPSANEVKANCLLARYYDVVDENAIPDQRWLDLVRGLVTYQRDYRWGHAEVERWLNGESPKVYWVRIHGSMSPEKCYQPSWSTELISSPEELAKSIGTHWQEAKKALVGREKGKIVEFLMNFDGHEQAISLLDEEQPVDKKLFILQLMLSPKDAPRFDGRTLEKESFRTQVHAASDGDKDAVTWLMNLVRSDALISYGEYQDDESTAAAGRNLKNWYDQAMAVKKFASEDKRHLADDAFAEALPELFGLAYKPRG